MDHTVPFRFSGYAGMDIGRDNGGVVDRSYADRAPFAFTGTIKKVIFDIKPHLTEEDEQALHESGAPRARGPRHQRIACHSPSGREPDNRERQASLTTGSEPPEPPSACCAGYGPACAAGGGGRDVSGGHVWPSPGVWLLAW